MAAFTELPGWCSFSWKQFLVLEPLGGGEYFVAGFLS